MKFITSAHRNSLIAAQSLFRGAWKAIHNPKGGLVFAVQTKTITIFDKELFQTVPMHANRTVSFLVAGTQKGGTTALHELLKSHSEICMSSKKEPHFFDTDRYLNNNQINSEYYLSLFPEITDDKLLGDVTPSYMYHPLAPARIYRFNPSIKIIFLLRNPVHRAYSQWNMQRRKGLESMSFESAIEREMTQRQDSTAVIDKKFAYLSRGLYAQQIKRYTDLFDRKNLLFVKSNTLKNQPQKALQAVASFLGICPFKLEEKQQTTHFCGNYEQPLSDATFNNLLKLFQNDIKETEKLSGLNLQAWKL